jgi:hypothetical protein
LNWKIATVLLDDFLIEFTSPGVEGILPVLNIKTIAIAGLLAAWPSLAVAQNINREVAEWALFMGGTVVLEGDQRRIRDVAELPAGDFKSGRRVWDLAAVNA